MNRLVLLAAILLFLVPQVLVPQISSHVTATISGRVLDRTGKPMANAVVVYTESFSGKVYQLKTNKNGEFFSLGIAAGYYKIAITAPDGSRVYSGTRSIGITKDVDPKPLKGNVLNVDLSTVKPNGEMAGSGNSEGMSPGEIEEIRRYNARIVKINQLVPELQIALDARDWPRATSILQELIAADPDRWEYYQNLGTIQSNLSQFEPAVQSFEKAIELARKAMPSAPSPVARANISGMLISQAEAYNRMGKLDESIARYHQAAELAAQPALAHFYACNALRTNRKLEAAIQECDRSIAADPRQWEPYQTKAIAESDLGKNADAIATYDAGIQAAKAAVASSLQPEKAKAGMGQMLNAEANAYIQLRQYDKAIPLFSQAAEVAAYPALPYFNLCAMFYNRNDQPAAVSACDNAIASDPTMADAYFIKAAVLFGQGKLQQGQYQVPDGTTAALNKYLELSPEGRHSSDARDMLEKIGAKIETTYKPKK